MPTIQIWFEYASTYTYLTIARIAKVAETSGVAVDWRPFLLLPVMKSFGMDQGPFIPFEAKQRYMWRDLERRALIHGLPYRRPSRYPPDSLVTARVGLLAAKEGWCREFTEKTFQLHWTEDRAIGTEDNLVETLSSLGKDPRSTLEKAAESPNKNALRTQTEKAQEIGIFGSPSFIANGELFWGDDRLEEAIAWARRDGG
ncbi:MAG: 2-hydroxychromene-2-carboxylate isomerase [Verrucomicrobia bacterium]|nr:2-hydroxychromene-2-carboxylate isomerase [Verrucomicrobiota bacterium]